MGSHAILGPSAAHRWIHCPASVRMVRDLPEEEDSLYAHEGTLFHTLCEIEVAHRVLGGSLRDYEVGRVDWALETLDEWVQDQLAYAEDWIKFVQECMAEDGFVRLLLEQRVETGIPGCWGTADAVLIYTDRIKVIDIKYGAGVKVSAHENPQGLLYGVGALSLVDDPLAIHEITVVIWQPRMDNISDYTITRKALLRWRDDLIPVAKLALGEDAPFGPSESACRWCPIAGTCKPRTDKMLAEDFGDPNLLTGEDMAEAYGRTSELKRWIADIEDAALKMAHDNAGSVPGFKVVRSGGRRSIYDSEKAIEVLLSAGWPSDSVYTRKPATLGELDKLVGGGEQLQEVLGDLLVKSEGRLSLARESDPRPEADAFHSARTDFADITESGVTP